MIEGHLYPGKFNGTCNRFFTLENLYLGLVQIETSSKYLKTFLKFRNRLKMKLLSRHNVKQIYI
jgi:glutaredoxin-related protein